MTTDTAAPPAASPAPGRSALFWERLDSNRVACGLCPQDCRIAPGKTGLCRVRRNVDGMLIADTYGRPAAMHVDPIEKKPLAWYRPGSRTFSIGTYGCNLACRFCQNDELSRHGGERQRALPFVSPGEIVELARSHGCQSVAFTYNEPTVFIEYALDVARLARQAGLGTVLVSNGTISPIPRAELYPLIDAANIDIKGFTEVFYAELCGSTLAPVLESCRAYKREFGGHLELTNLIIPNRNDAPGMIEALLDWVAAELGADTPLHFSAYHPMGGFTEPPTPPATVRMAVEMARRHGFTRLKAGNIRS
jgi:pyruvate formate lyase activating enzyme